MVSGRVGGEEVEEEDGLLGRTDHVVVSDSGKEEVDGVAWGGGERQQGRGRAAVGQDGGRRRGGERGLGKDGVAFGGVEWPQGRGRAAGERAWTREGEQGSQLLIPYLYSCYIIKC